MTSHSEALTEIAKIANASAYAVSAKGALDQSTVSLTAALINYQAAQLIAGEIALLRDKLHDVNENIWRGAK